MDPPPTSKTTLFALYSFFYVSSAKLILPLDSPNASLPFRFRFFFFFQETCFGALRRELDHSNTEEILEVK